MPESNPPHPTICHLGLAPDSIAPFFIALTGLFLARLPMIISAIMMGKPIMRIQPR